MNPEEYRKKLELDILKIMEEKLSRGEMQPEKAQAIARMVLVKLHPPLTLEQIYRIAPTLDDQFAELTQAVLPVINDRDEKLKQIVGDHAKKLIEKGRFNEATILLRQANESKKVS